MKHDPTPTMNGATVGRPLIRVVGAAILRPPGLPSSECLVAQRHDDMSLPRKWEFPGGKVEPGEDPPAALIREIREELDLEIKILSWLGRGFDAQKRRRIELEVFTAEVVSGEPSLREHRQLRWIGAAEIVGLDWAPADRPLLPALEKILDSSRR